MRRLRYRLIAVLLVVALLPAIPAAWTVRELLERSVGSGAEETILAGARAGLAGAREQLELEKERFARRIVDGASVDTLRVRDYAALDASERQTLETMTRADDAGIILAGPDRVTLGGREHLAVRLRRADGTETWVTTPLPSDLVARARSLAETVRQVETLRRDRGTIVRGLVFTFLAVYGVLLVLILVLGLLLASRLTRPLERLGEGIDRVAAGDLAVRVDTASAGHLARLIEQFNRMTERIRTQRDDLVRLEKLAAWRNLARRLAHEIKNPLTPIQLAAQQMRDSYPGEEAEVRRTLEEGAGIVEEEVRSLRNLVREFSDFARLPEPKLRATRVRSLLDDLTALYGDEAVHCALSPDDDTLTAWCDSDEIHRVLINLVNNALQAQEETGDSDPIQVTAGAGAGGGVVVEVRDHGPGVPPEDRSRIFAPDYSSKSEGMGLGLAIVEGIVQAHGGSIAVAGGNDGAVFRFTLPSTNRGKEEGTS